MTHKGALESLLLRDPGEPGTDAEPTASRGRPRPLTFCQLLGDTLLLLPNLLLLLFDPPLLGSDGLQVF